MITKHDIDGEIDYFCSPAKDLELLERNPLKNPEKGDTFFCHPKDGEPFKLIVYIVNDNYDVKVAKNGESKWYMIDEFRFLIFSVPSNYMVFSKTV